MTRIYENSDLPPMWLKEKALLEENGCQWLGRRRTMAFIPNFLALLLALGCGMSNPGSAIIDPSSSDSKAFAAHSGGMQPHRRHCLRIAGGSLLFSNCFRNFSQVPTSKIVGFPFRSFSTIGITSSGDGLGLEDPSPAITRSV